MFKKSGIFIIILGLFSVSSVLASDTFYPSADGYIKRSNGAEYWATIQPGDGTHVDNSTEDSVFTYIEASSTTDKYNSLWRGGFVFDTSSLPDNAIISDVVFSVYVTGHNDNLGGSVNVVSFSPAADDTFVTGDFTDFGSTDYATDIDIDTVSNSAYLDFTFNDTGKSSISLNGNTKIGLRIDKDINNSEPSWVSSGYSYISGLHTETATNKPKLVITYTTPTPTPTAAPTSTPAPTATPSAFLSEADYESIKDFNNVVFLFMGMVVFAFAFIMSKDIFKK